MLVLRGWSQASCETVKILTKSEQGQWRVRTNRAIVAPTCPGVKKFCEDEWKTPNFVTTSDLCWLKGGNLSILTSSWSVTALIDPPSFLQILFTQTRCRDKVVKAKEKVGWWWTRPPGGTSICIYDKSMFPDLRADGFSACLPVTKLMTGIVQQHWYQGGQAEYCSLHSNDSEDRKCQVWNIKVYLTRQNSED